MDAIDPKDIFIEPKEPPYPKKVMIGNRIYVLESEAAACIRRLIVEARIDEAERKGENKDYGVVHYNDDGSTFTLLDSRITELQQQLTDGGQQDGKS